MEIGHIVRRKDTDAKGVVVGDPYGVCSLNEVPVNYEGLTGFVGTPKEFLEDLGPENAKPDPGKCGIGKGEQCCIFFSIGRNGLECQRRGNLRDSLILNKGKMTAKREPTEIFPNCQL